MNETNDRVLQGEASIWPSRLFDDNLGYLSPASKDLVSFFEPGGEGSQPIQHPAATAGIGTYELEVEQVDMAIGWGENNVGAGVEDGGNISGVEDGDEASGVESLEANSRCKAKHLKEIQKRASEAKERQQKSLGDLFTPADNATPTSLGRAAAKVGRARIRVASEFRATSMDEKHTPYHPPDLESSNTMDVSPYQGQAAPVDTIFEEATCPRKFPLQLEACSQLGVCL